MVKAIEWTPEMEKRLSKLMKGRVKQKDAAAILGLTLSVVAHKMGLMNKSDLSKGGKAINGRSDPKWDTKGCLNIGSFERLWIKRVAKMRLPELEFLKHG